MTIQRSYHFEAPVEAVFEFFKDPNQWAEVSLMDVHDVKVTKEGVGTNYTWGVKLAGIPVQGFEVLTDVVPNKHISERSSMAMAGKWEYDFEPEGTGTKVTVEIEPRSFWKLAPLAKMVELGFGAASDRFMPRFKDKIEATSRA